MREFPSFPRTIEQAEQFFADERDRLELQYNRDQQRKRGRMPAKQKRLTIEQRLAAKRKPR